MCSMFLQCAMHTTKWCTPQSLAPRFDAHRGVGLHSMMHPAESDSGMIFCSWLLRIDSTVWCTPHSFSKVQLSFRNWKIIWKYFSLFVRGPRWVRIIKKIEVNNLVTHLPFLVVSLFTGFALFWITCTKIKMCFFLPTIWLEYLLVGY